MCLRGAASKQAVRYLLIVPLCAACGGGTGMPPDRGGYFLLDLFTHNQQAANFAIYYSSTHTNRAVLVWAQCAAPRESLVTLRPTLRTCAHVRT